MLSCVMETMILSDPSLILIYFIFSSTDVRDALVGVGLLIKDDKSGLAMLEKGV